ncbi:hypothetical protein [Ideonella sp.]|uniref:hypothetical protein n=1 Tax=Ideonella sp. TaxID=1929293 RepID=UPI0035B08903
MATAHTLTRSAARRFALVAGLAALALGATAAQAAQKTVSNCSVDGTGGGNVVSHLSQNGWQAIPGMSRTLNNTGTVAKSAYITFSADAGVDADAELRLAFSLDNGAPFYAGPQNLGNQQQYWAARSAVAVISVPPGSHTIKAMWLVNGVAGKNGFMDDRCMLVTF